MAYNLTELANADTIYKLVVFSNNASSSLLIVLLVLALFFIMLMALKRFEFDAALFVSSFVCFIVSALFVYAELLSLIWALGFLIIAAFTAMFIFFSK
jgi:hypothetical protein